MREQRLKNDSGMTLIELLIVMLLLGLVLGAVYSLYITHSRSAYVEEEVVEVQQNLRIAAESISRDIRMAGFLVPLDDPTFPNKHTDPNNNIQIPVRDYQSGGIVHPGYPNSDKIILNETSASGIYATLDEDVTGIPNTLQVDSSDSVDVFSVGDTVRVIDSAKKVSVSSAADAGAPDRIYKITATNRANKTLSLVYASGNAANLASIPFKKGNVIARVTDGSPVPNSIAYRLVDNTESATCPAQMLCLARITNEGAPGGVPDTQVIATNISNLQFSYLLDTGAETATPDDMQPIRAVRTTITAQTVTTTAYTGNSPKSRTIEFVVEPRNR